MHPNSVPTRLAHLDKIADRIAAELAPIGFVDVPREDDNEVRYIDHPATKTYFSIGLTGVRLSYFDRPDAKVGPRTVCHTIRVGYEPVGAPAQHRDVDGIVLIARLAVAYFTTLDAQQDVA
ncbi:Hypothetical protein AJAP_42715 (plasmid) [Amycolatopsis japonica]|uniref:Uncharacterized protein n=1 Tax=Amycolatopsis japonica TaxID=208439 RepID=A0A075VEH1_9PSEU|nr:MULTISPECIES: hypothetical protein [Amycolatopsis]AIG81310.1 Hypothetical protein AJAP_42715 [Amycolatopsis japonica]RSN38621.1 hypothetical protein DMC64_41890 [Amycolatopsis sp. WAC 04197]